MDELEISGKRYISSRRAAKEHKYHSDYIGQLIRGGKVVGQKVGRSWYVEADSLDKYFSGEGDTEIAAVSIQQPQIEDSTEKVAEVAEAPEIKVEEKISIPSPSSPTPVHTPAPKVIKEEQVDVEYKIPVHVHVQKKVGGLTYMSDESPLLPEIKKSEREVPVTVHEEPQVSHAWQEIASPPTRKARPVLLAVLGVLTFLGVAAGSYLLTYTAIIEEGAMKANVSVSFP